MTLWDDEQFAARAIEAEAYEEAVCLLRPLVERNSEYALLTLGWIYETGAGCVPDGDAARLYYEHAAAQGSGSAYLGLGRLFQAKGDEARARAAFETGAQLDDEECKSALARLDDEGVERLAVQAMEAEDYGEALRLIEPLAERNSPYALHLLGWIYETGATGPADMDEARSNYERATVEGIAAAYLDLGRLLLAQGEDSQARSAFEAGAERGDFPCMFRLGRMLLAGRGGPPDVAAGYAWLEKAAEQGHFFAQRTLLGIQFRNAKSLFRKLAVALKIASLGIRGAKEVAKDPHSDKVKV